VVKRSRKNISSKKRHKILPGKRAIRDEIIYNDSNSKTKRN
jgi:hypothetical protein